MQRAQPLHLHPPGRVPPPPRLPRRSAPRERASPRGPHRPAARAAASAAVQGFQDRLAAMAETMRCWAPEVRQLAERLTPLLPQAKAMRRMAEANRETLAVFLYTAADSILGDVLARAIAELERYARAGEDPAARRPDRGAQERVWREIDPQPGRPRSRR